MLTEEQIAQAKAATRYSTGEAHHEHDDCIRIAYEWLDAQNTIISKPTHSYALKHLIEKWGGRYVSQSDVDVAAALHPKISGLYPRFNLSAKLVLPDIRRLDGLNEAFTQGYQDRMTFECYASREDGEALPVRDRRSVSFARINVEHYPTVLAALPASVDSVAHKLFETNIGRAPREGVLPPGWKGMARDILYRLRRDGVVTVDAASQLWKAV